MDIEFILKVAGVGMIVAVICQMLSKAGREEQSMMVSLAGILVVLMMLVSQLGSLLDSIRGIFGL